MSESESENESGLDFSASEDEFVPTEDDDSEEDEYDESEEDQSANARTSSKKIKKMKPSPTVRKTTEHDDDSDSSVENYLVNPNDIDLASDFFDSNKVVASNVPKFDCNVGLSLTDSEEEIFEAVPSTSQNVKLMDFNAHENFNKNLENAKEQLRNFTSTNFGQDNSGDNVTQLLAMGEPSLVAKKSSKSKKSRTKREDVSSDESDFEEVEDNVKPEKGDNVEVRIGPALKKKTDKFQAEIEASIKRKINRRKKENQLMMHKVHLLSWIAYGNHVNKVLNSTKLMEMIVKFIPSEKCYPKDKTDQKFFEQISKWYKTTVGLKNNEQNCDLKCLPPIATSLALQIQSKMAICKKDFVFIFIVLLRSMGIQCRLVINLATMPMRPAAKDLCVISTKNPEKAESSGKAKPEKKNQTKKETVSSSKEQDSKDRKLRPKAGKLKPQVSISGKSSEILPKSPETLSQKKTLKSKIQAAMKSTRNESIVEPIDDKKVNLKRSVSVQSISSVNDNNKRSRVETFNNATTSNALKTRSNNHTGKETATSNEDSKKNLKRRSMSLQSPPSIKVAKMSLNEPKAGILSKAKAANMEVNPSPVSRRTRRAVARNSSIISNATSSSQNIPQLDGGDDKRSKKRNPDYKIKFPLRARSVTSNGSSELAQPMQKTVAIASPTRGRRRANSNTIKIRLPSISRSTSKSPTSTAGHISRKSKFEKTNSIASSSSPTKSSSNLENISKTSNADTEKTKEPTEKSKRAQSSSKASNANLVRTASVPSASNSDKQMSQKTEVQKKNITRPKRGQPSSQATKSSTKSPTPSTSKVTVPAAPLQSPTKLTSNSDKTGTISKATKIANLSKKSTSKTKSSSVAVASSSSNSTVLTSTDEKKSKPIARSTSTGVEKPTKRKSTTNSASSDSDFAPTPKKKLSPGVDKPLPRQVANLKKRIDRRVLSTDDESIEPPVKKDDMNYWVEVYCEAESKWICIDLFKAKVDCVDDIKKKATKPIAYVFAWNNNNKIKDVSPRYCSQWNTTTRKLRVPNDWLDEAISRYKEPLSQRCVAEDRELEEIHAQTPIPTSISEFKNHPLYVLSRHLLKFEGIYPPNPVPIAYIRNEPIYSRLCVHTLHSREIWVKQARVVNPGETPYKIVKARPKWDRLANKMLEAQPLEIFGRWQTGPYVPPTAENGIVPRNAYGNVELFKPEMLPKKTVHLRLAGLNRVCHKLKIDCAQAVVGFDFHGGSSHPTFDGFVVCEEFAELVTERWCEEQEESNRKAQEKQNQRIYDNWKKLIKGLLIRQRLQRKYNFAGKDASPTSASSDKK